MTVVNILRSRFGAEKIGLCTFHFMKTIFKVFRNTGIMETFIKEKRAESEYSLSIGNIFSIYVLPYNRIHEKAGPIIDKIISFEDNIDIRIKWLEFKNYFLNNWSNIETAKMLSKYEQHTITTNDIEIYHASLSRYVKMGPSLGLRRYTEALLHLQLDTEIGIKQLEIERFKITSKEKEMENYRSNDLKYAPRLLQRIKMNDKNEAFDDYVKSRDSNRFLSAITKIRAVKKVKIEYGSCDDGSNDNENVHKQWFTDMNIENIILNEIGITFSGERSYLLNVHISTILGYESLYKIENKKLIDDGLKLIFENGLCKYENVFMPMNTAGVYKRGSHWILGHLSRSKNCFFIYDSLNSTSEDVAERIVSRIRNAHHINLSHSVSRNIPQQNNGYDCGA
uniref:ULP_PROTEASE domain-containing protein n=1 Tax=Strongyloides papillosus TaxID=174720 RepID=A0A0N5BZE0_STREA